MGEHHAARWVPGSYQSECGSAGNLAPCRSVQLRISSAHRNRDKLSDPERTRLAREQAVNPRLTPLVTGVTSASDLHRRLPALPNFSDEFASGFASIGARFMGQVAGAILRRS